MLEFLKSFHPVVQALFATLFTWGLTAIGAAMVFFTTREINRRLFDFLLGFSAGVMIAVSFWSLLTPAIEMSEGKDLPIWVPSAVGFMLGGIFIRVVDKLLPHVHLFASVEEAEGIKTTWKRVVLLICAITLHNIPEGLAVGVAFGGVVTGLPEATLGGAVALAVGMGLQNLPEGMAVSMPLRREGFSRFRCFWYGQLSGIVEPIAGVLGAWAVITMHTILPYALGFAAGAMIFVVVEELIPESQRGKHPDVATAGTMIGFVVMMILDISFG